MKSIESVKLIGLIGLIKSGQQKTYYVYIFFGIIPSSLCTKDLKTKLFVSFFSCVLKELKKYMLCFNSLLRRVFIKKGLD